MCPLSNPLRAARRLAAFVLTSSCLFALGTSADPLPLSWEAVRAFPNVREHAAALDDARDRLLVSGGSGTEGQLWALDLNELRWSYVGGLGRGLRHGMVYDSERDALMGYGGYSNLNTAYYQDGFRLALETNLWTSLGPAGWMPPGERTNFALLLDPNHDRVLVLGRDATPCNTVYYYDILANTWSSAACTGAYPTSDVGRGAVVDVAGDRVLTFTDFVREMPLSGAPAWSVLSPGGTSPPSLAGRPILDAARSRVLLFRDDMTVWALSLGTSPAWSQVFSGGTAPSARNKFTLTLDAERDRALLCGGWVEPVGPAYNDTWSFDFATNTWSSLLSPGGAPPPRSKHSAVRASALDALVAFGGDGGSSVYVLPLSAGGAGTTLTTSGTPPSSRSATSTAYDAVRNRLLVFGGYTNSGFTYLGDVHALTLDGTPTWSQITAPSGPAARIRPSSLYDPIRDRLIVVGGSTANSSDGRSDVWALSLSGSPTWQQLVADGTIPALYPGTVAVYDSLRDRIVLVGRPSSDPYLGAWALDLTGTPAWTSLAPAGQSSYLPSFMAGTLDTYGDRILLHGGLGPSDYFVDQLTSLSLGATPTFEVLTLPGAPLPRAWSTLVYDPIRYRSLLYGGMENPSGGDMGAYAAQPYLLRGDLTTDALASLVSADVVGREARITWLVSDAAYATWRVERSLHQGEWESLGAPVAEPGDHLSFRDANLPAGAHAGYRLVATENGAERRMGEVWLAVPVTESFALARVSFANGRTLRWAAVAPGDAKARLDVFDVGGRCLGGQGLSPSGMEQQGELRLDSTARAGVYFVRLSQGSRSVTRRLALLN